MPGPIQHFGLSVPRIIEELYLTTDGLFGLVTGVSATYIYMFVLFGAFLTSTKASEFFNDVSMALTGHLKGGPAKIAVVSSALMGTISGSTSANVATTGAFTIPLMKEIGYKPHFAAAVEAAASTGGQIMPRYGELRRSLLPIPLHTLHYSIDSSDRTGTFFTSGEFGVLLASRLPN